MTVSMTRTMSVSDRINCYQRCEKHPLEVERNFRKLLDVPQNRFVSAISNTFSVRYTEELRQQLEDSPFDIFLYSSRQDSVFRIPVAGSFTAGDVINILRNFFRLPKPATFSDENIQVSLNHSLVFDGKKVPLKNTLGEVGVVHGSVVTFWTQFAWKDLEDFRFDGDVIHYGQPVSGGPNDTSVGEISVKTGNNARNGGKNSLNRPIRCVCGKKIGPDPRNFNQRVSLGRNDLLIRTFPKSFHPPP